MIATRGLRRTFGATVAVDELDLDVHRGEVFGFLGPNGAGKTTTIQMLCGLLSPTAGTIAIAGHDWRDDPQAVRRSFALAPDTPPLYDWLTVREYVGFVASLYGVAAGDRDAGSARFLAALDLEARADSLCKTLSHGMKKKAHLAAILTVAPPLLILDEPTNGLDPQSTRRFKDLVGELRDGGTTVFLSTHVLDVAEQICDRIGVLHRGRLLACGTMAELRRGDAPASLEDVFLALTAGDAATGGTEA
jgi:ABC-2 type transport system ATP-binding protein